MQINGEDLSQTPQPLRTSTPARIKQPRRVMDSDFSSGEEEFVLPFSTHNAGSTPHNNFKGRSLNFSMPSANTTVLDDINVFIEQQRRESCLFGTLHIKGFTALIALFDLYFISDIDNKLYTQHLTIYKYSETLAFTVPLLIAVLVALIGLQRNHAQLLIPLIFMHVFLSLIYYLVLGPHFVHQITFVYESHEYFSRLLMILIKRCIVAFVNAYVILTLCRCYLFLKKGSMNIPILCVVNENFNPNCDTMKSIDKDNDIILFENAKKSKSSTLVASPGSVGSRKCVRFMDALQP